MSDPLAQPQHSHRLTGLGHGEVAVETAGEHAGASLQQESQPGVTTAGQTDQRHRGQVVAESCPQLGAVGGGGKPRPERPDGGGDKGQGEVQERREDREGQ